MTALPGQVVHRGSIAAAGIVFEYEPAGEAALRAHVLRLWQPGASLLALDAGRALLRLATPMRVQAELCPGTPVLRDVDGNLLASPLSAAERELLALDGRSLVVVQAGRAVVYALAACAVLDPAQWLDLGGFEWLEGEALSSPRQAPEAAASVVEPARDLRAVLGDSVPQPASEQAAMLEELRKRFVVNGASSQRQLGRSSWLAHALQAWRALFARHRTAGAGSSGAAAGAGVGLQRRTPWARALDWLNARIAQLLYATPLSWLFDTMHSRYLRALLERFERGDLREALRHAIPLSDRKAAEALRLALSPPGPRADLTLAPRAVRAMTTVSVQADALALLRRTYEAAARKLEIQGRIEEAAFAWADLLGDTETAVALLERHARLAAAAELAEGRELAPGLVVRQWFIAGNVERALAVARRHDAFADAVVRLEKSARYADAADALRLLYGEALANAGDYAGAVDVLWAMARARHLAAAFLERAREAGGAQSGRALARMLALGLGPAESLLQQVRALAHDPEPHAPIGRLAFGRALLAQKPVTPMLRAGAQAALRALLGDASRGQIVLDSALRKGLLALAADPALQADLPAPCVRTAPDIGRRAVIEQRIGESDRGSVGVEDAALLPGGRVLVALGELGMRLYRADQRRYTGLLEPAHRLVVNEDGTRALALAMRGRRVKLARADLIAGRADAWCDAELERFATEFDGTRWFVAQAGSLVSIDATGDDFRALWRVPNLVGRDGAVVGLSARGDFVEVLVDDSGYTYFRYETATLKLRHRADLVLPGAEGEQTWLGCVRPGAAQLLAFSVDPEQAEPGIFLRAGGLALRLGNVGEPIHNATLDAHGEWVAVALMHAAGSEVLLVHLGDQRVVLRLELEGSRRVTLRLGEQALVVADELGRVRALSLCDGGVVCDMRIAI